MSFRCAISTAGWAEATRIDVHAHFRTDEYLDVVEATADTDTAAQRGPGAGDGADVDARLAQPDRAGTVMQALCASPRPPDAVDDRAAFHLRQ